MKTVAVVPIKMNNERLPGKNTKCFDNGEPLIKYVLSSLSKVKNIDEIYVFCSNETICEYLPENVKYLKREEWLDLSSTSITDVLTSFADNVDADIYVLSHATAPFISSESIEKALQQFNQGNMIHLCLYQKFRNSCGKTISHLTTTLNEFLARKILMLCIPKQVVSLFIQKI